MKAKEKGYPRKSEEMKRSPSLPYRHLSSSRGRGKALFSAWLAPVRGRAGSRRLTERGIPQKNVKNQEKAIALCVALACLFTLIMPFGFALAEAGKPSEILAEKVSFSQLAPGDRFVIVSESANAAISMNPSKQKLAPADVTLGHTDSREVLTAMAPETAVFQFEPQEGGDIRLKCQSGYLTSTGARGGLAYAPDPGPNSLWRVVDDSLLYSPGTVMDYHGAPSSNVYIEYYPNGACFSLYPREDPSDACLFELALYRLGDSAPGENVCEDAYYLLPVFETSDTHGYLADFDDDATLYLLAYISDKVQDVRGHGADARKDYAVLVDGGDIYQGNTLSSRFNGSSLSAAYNLMGYDAVTLGNHEFDWSLERVVDPDGTMPDYSLLDNRGVNTTPVVVCNLYQNGEKVPFAGDYVILDKTARDRLGNEMPVKIGVIGMAGDYGDSILRSQFSDLGYVIRPDYDYVNALARELEADGRCDATILLIHDGPTDVAEALGEDTAIDLLLGGHLHKAINWETARGLRYMEPSYDGQAYAYAELAFDGAAGRPGLVGVKNAHIHLTNADEGRLLNVPANAGELDAALVRLTDEVVDAVSDFLSSEVGAITQPILRFQKRPDGQDRASVCGNWVASIFARAMDADVGFMNSGGLRTDLEISPGEDRRTVTLSDLYRMFPSENIVCCYELTWGELLTALEYSLTPGGNILLTYVVGVDCYFTDQGINALVTPDGEAVYVNGAWKDGWRDRKLRVALNEYIATTNRKRGDEMPNPFVAWYDSPRLIENSETDIDGAIRVLVREAADNGGLLSVDTAVHFINGVYPAE